MRLPPAPPSLQLHCELFPTCAFFCFWKIFIALQKGSHFLTALFFFPCRSVPDAPTDVTGAPLNLGTPYLSATVNWTAPFDGGSPITDYIVTCFSSSDPSPVVGPETYSAEVTCSGSSSCSIVPPGYLPNFNSYICEVSAINAIGESAASESAPFEVTCGDPCFFNWAPAPEAE